MLGKRGKENNPFTMDKLEHAAALVLQIKASREYETPMMPKERRSAGRHLQVEEEHELCCDDLYCLKKEEEERKVRDCCQIERLQVRAVRTDLETIALAWS